MKRKEQRIYFLIASLAAFLFALSTPVSKYLLSEVHPVFLAALFYLATAVFLLPFTKNFFKDLNVIKTKQKDLKRILGAIFTGGILGPILLLYGIKLIQASSAALLLNMETVATSFLAFFLFKEHLGKKTIIASIMVFFAGLLLVFQRGNSFTLGGIFIILACFAWGFDNNYTATIESISSRSITILKGLFAGIFNLLLAIIFFSIDISLKNFILALLLGFFSYGLSITLYVYSAKNLGAARSQIIFASNPFIGALLSFLFFQDMLGLKFIFALVLMIIGVAILYTERHEHTHEHEAEEHIHEHSHDDGHHSHEHKGLNKNKKHIHVHRHKHIRHAHFHFPDIHHKHSHK